MIEQDKSSVEGEVKVDSTVAAVEQKDKEEAKDSPDTREDAMRAGTKVAVANSDAMAIAKDKAEAEGEPAIDAVPSFFVDDKAKHRVEVDILSNKKTGQVLSVSRSGIGLNFKEFEYLRHDPAWFEFSVPTYEDMSTYRQRCGTYRQEAGQVIIDRLQMRNFLLVWHLKDWSLIDKDGKKVELKHDENGSLGDASVKKVYSLHPTIVDVILTVFEKDILLT